MLRWLRRLFDYGIKRHYLTINPAAAFDLADAGGKEEARDRALSLDEIAHLFQAMKNARGSTKENDLTVLLLLLLGVRKMELVGSKWAEFDLDAAVRNLPAHRIKTEKAVRIPLAPIAIEILRDLYRLACGSDYVFPARGWRRKKGDSYSNFTCVATAPTASTMRPPSLMVMRYSSSRISRLSDASSSVRSFLVASRSSISRACSAAKTSACSPVNPTAIRRLTKVCVSKVMVVLGCPPVDSSLARHHLQLPEAANS